MATVLFFAFSLIWYLPLYFRQGKTEILPFRYCLLAIFLGMVPVFIVSVAVQVLWGSVRTWLGLTGWARYAFEAFFTAALTEELFKYAAALFVIKKAKPKRMIDYALLFGGVGLGFGLTESAIGVTNVGNAVFSSLMAFHLFWQYFMGLEYYEYRKRAPGGRVHLVLALLVPFLMHGMNDFFAFSLTDIMKLKQLDDLSAVTILGALLWVAVFLVFIIYILIRLNRAVERKPAINVVYYGIDTVLSALFPMKDGNEKYEKMLDIENSVIVISGLIPWCNASSVPLRTMGVSAAALPLAFYL